MNNIYPYAGFWKRAAAWFIDGLVIYMASTLVQQILTPLLISPQTAQKIQQMQDKTAPFDPGVFLSLLPLIIGLIVIVTVLPWIYFAWMESSSKQATLGKMALGIKVVDRQGNRLSFKRALGRTLAKIISKFILNIGYYMAGATRKKQALHDKMAGTYVVDNGFQPGDDLPEVETHFGILATVIITEVLCMLAVVGLFIGAINFVVRQAKTNTVPRAVAKLQELAKNHDKLATPLQENGNVYYRHKDGYRVVLNDAFSNTLFLQDGTDTVCCEQRLGTDCTATKLPICE